MDKTKFSFRLEDGGGDKNSKDDLVHVLEQTDYVEYDSGGGGPNCTSWTTACGDNFKDQFDGDFYDYDTWTEPPEGQGTTTTATTTTRRPFTFRTKPPPKSVTKKPSWSQDVSDPKYSSAKDQGHTKQPYPTVNPVPKQPPPAIKDPTTVLPSTLLNPDPKPTKPPLKDPYLPKTLNPDIATQPPKNLDPSKPPATDIPIKSDPASKYPPDPTVVKPVDKGRRKRHLRFTSYSQHITDKYLTIVYKY